MKEFVQVGTFLLKHALGPGGRTVGSMYATRGGMMATEEGVRIGGNIKCKIKAVFYPGSADKVKTKSWKAHKQGVARFIYPLAPFIGFLIRAIPSAGFVPYAPIVTSFITGAIALYNAHPVKKYNFVQDSKDVLLERGNIYFSEIQYNVRPFSEFNENTAKVGEIYKRKGGVYAFLDSNGVIHTGKLNKEDNPDLLTDDEMVKKIREKEPKHVPRIQYRVDNPAGGKPFTGAIVGDFSVDDIRNNPTIQKNILAQTSKKGHTCLMSEATKKLVKNVAITTIRVLVVVGVVASLINPVGASLGIGAVGVMLASSFISGVTVKAGDTILTGVSNAIVKKYDSWKENKKMKKSKEDKLTGPKKRSK